MKKRRHYLLWLGVSVSITAIILSFAEFASPILFRELTPLFVLLSVSVVGVFLAFGVLVFVSWCYPSIRKGACLSCNYNLTGNTTGTCPESTTVEQHMPSIPKAAISVVVCQ